MKGIGSLIICLFTISSSLGQELRIEKEKIEGINQFPDSIYYKPGRPLDSTSNPEMSV
jgi:hypothetical protein